MRSLFTAAGVEETEVEARCLLVFSLFVGSRFVAARTILAAAAPKCSSSQPTNC